MRTTPTQPTRLPLAGHHGGEVLGLEGQDGRDGRDAGGGREGLAPTPHPDRGLEDADLGRKGGLGLFPCIKQFTERHVHAFSSTLNGFNKFFANLAEVLDFSGFLYQKIKDARLSQAALGGKLGLSGGSFVNQVLKHTSPLPEDQVDKWAECLGLSDKDRDMLWDLWAIHQMPARLQPRFYAMYGRFHSAKARLDVIEKRLESP